MDLVQDRVLEVFRHVVLKQLKAIAVDGADVHVGHSGHIAEQLRDTRGDAVLEFRSRPVGECEGDDVPGFRPWVGLAREDARDSLGKYLSLARTSARDDLEVLLDRLDGVDLLLCVGEIDRPDTRCADGVAA